MRQLSAPLIQYVWGTILNNYRRVDPVRIDTDLADAYLHGERIGELFTNFQTCPEDWLTPGYIADIPGVDGAYVSAVGDNGRRWPCSTAGQLPHMMESTSAQ